MARFVLEIGTEEIPARFLAAEQADAARLMANALETGGLAYSSLSVMATPRRLAVIVEGMPERQETREELVTGPPAAVAYDASGAPTRALIGFAAGNHVSPDEVFRHATPRGEYVACRKVIGGLPTREALEKIAPQVIESIPFGKRMRWGKNTFLYARPVVWILALLDGDIVSFQVAGLASGRLSEGHRVHGRGPHEVDHAAHYERLLAEKGHVVLNPRDRLDKIVAEGNALAEAIGGRIIWKDGLLNEVTGLVEHPAPMLGDFSPTFLEIPEEVLLTSMESHQKSFGLRGGDGHLLPHFLTVLNVSPKDMGLVKKGWERVLRARLEDARFFWQADLKDSFDAWLKKLEDVIFIGPLGSMGDKSRRLEALCQWLAARLPVRELAVAEAARAGRLAKADLVSAMVGEFDTLQGIMGGIYAERRGEAPAVAVALREQYLPAGPDTPLPQSPLGAILSIADKADTLVGCFGLGQVPTGASDPNGLRRCALGIIRILINMQWQIDVRSIFQEAQNLYGGMEWKVEAAEAMDKLLEFFRGRLRNFFMLKGYDTTFVDAALGSGYLNPADTQERLDALVAFSQDEHFGAAAQTLKRVENVGKKAAADTPDKWDNGLLQEDAEKSLAAVLDELLPRLDSARDARDYGAMLAALVEVRRPVDNFFDNVLVMCEDEDLRRNRLTMLKAISDRYDVVARFSSLQL